MTATTADLTAAQNGLRVAVISRNHEDVRTELERLALFAGADATIRRVNGGTSISFGGEGGIRFHSASSTTLHGSTYDRVHLATNAVSDETIEAARAALTPDGELYIGAHLVDPDRDDAAQ